MKYDPLDTKGREHQDKERLADAKRKAEQALLDIEWLLSSVEGRRVLWRLLDLTGVYRSSYTGNSETFFREGARNVGLILLADIQRANPEGFLTMLKEHRNE